MNTRGFPFFAFSFSLLYIRDILTTKKKTQRREEEEEEEEEGKERKGKDSEYFVV